MISTTMTGRDGGAKQVLGDEVEEEQLAHKTEDEILEHRFLSDHTKHSPRSSADEFYSRMPQCTSFRELSDQARFYSPPTPDSTLHSESSVPSQWPPEVLTLFYTP